MKQTWHPPSTTLHGNKKSHQKPLMSRFLVIPISVSSCLSGLGIFGIRAALDVSLHYAVVVAFRDCGVVVPFLGCSFLDEIAISSDSTSGLREHFINHFNMSRHPWNGLSCQMVNFVLLFILYCIHTITYILFPIIRATWSCFLCQETGTPHKSPCQLLTSWRFGAGADVEAWLKDRRRDLYPRRAAGSESSMFLVLFVPPATSWDFIKTSSKSQYRRTL